MSEAVNVPWCLSFSEGLDEECEHTSEYDHCLHGVCEQEFGVLHVVELSHPVNHQRRTDGQADYL